MAQELDNGEFWLPPQFLTDDDILMDFKKQTNSDLTSPVESVMGSTETESDEEDYLTGLTWKMANSTLNDDMWRVDKAKTWGMATSPQSTLCNVMGTCSCKNGSSRGSPTCPSPPATGGTNPSDGAWDLLYAAAGEVARIKMAEQVQPSRKPAPISVPIKTHNTNLGIHSNNHPLPYHQLQAAQFQHLKQQQMFKQQQYQQSHHQQMVQNRARNSINNKPVGLSMSAWPTLQQSQQPQRQGQPSQPQPQMVGSGMRAIFLGNPGTKRECAGTGVFLPRQISTIQTESRKKRGGCSTVLLPERVVQALNLNLDAMDAHPQPRIHTPDYGKNHSLRPQALNLNRSAVMAQQPTVRQPVVPIENELRLPQEWTY